MKCPNCGADIKNGYKICEFCDSSITADMKREQEYVNKVGCPKCGSSDIIFNRETQGEVKSKKPDFYRNVLKNSLKNRDPP